ncbi:MAG: ABC transporter substrate-binding protein [Alphaproteobacteria bacterium]|nr:ABC transporter substrate-binding protein [Alphaproteobacteria bacterium]
MTPRLAVVALLLAALLGCGRTAAPRGRDDGRLLSLAPAITATLRQLGAQDRLVGRSDWCTGDELAALPTLGSALTPDLERIAGLQPATVLVDGSAATRLDDLRAVAPVEELPWLTTDEVAGSLRRLGALTGTSATADPLAARLEATLGRAPPAHAPRVLVALGSDGLEGGEVWFVKRNSLHGAVLHAAGVRNAVDRDVPGVPMLSLEALIDADPDAVVVLSATPVDDAGRARLVEAWARLTPLRAVQQGRLGVIDGEVAMATDPRILDLVDLLHAELRRLGLELP